MNRVRMYFTFFLMVAMISSMVGCSEDKYEGTPDFNGVVLSIEETRIMMKIQSGKMFESGYKGDIILSYKSTKDIEHIAEGQEVKVWLLGEVDDSNPPRGTLGKYEIIE